MFEERKYEELKRLGTELHIPIFEAFLKLEVFDKEGNPVREHSQRSHSWVRNAYNTMFTHLAGKDADDSTFGAGKLSVTDTGNTIRYGNSSICLLDAANVGVDGLYDDWADAGGYRSPGSDDTVGILIGTGTNAESFEDYVLQTPVADGVSAGQLSHIQSNAHSITYTAGTKVLKNDLIRYFNNNSGGSIVVAEVALVVAGFIAGGTRRKWLQSRDKLGATVTVADTGQLKVTYTIQITYPG